MKLFCPGPVEMTLNVKEAMINCNIGHRSIEFQKIFSEMKQNLLTLTNADNSYEVLILSASGSAANEAVVASIFNSKDNVLILSNGEFGNRFYSLIRHYNIKCTVYNEQWGSAFNYIEVENELKQNNYTYVVVAHDETSSGMINDLNIIGMLCLKYDVKLFADCVSSLASDEVDLLKQNISIMTSSSGKAIGATPGASIIVIKKDILEQTSNNIVSSKYLNLHTYYQYSVKYSQTPNTPNIHCFIALHEAVKECLNYNKSHRYQELSNYLRTEMQNLEFTTIIDHKHMSNSVTTFKCPNNLNYLDVYNMLYEKGFVCYLGGNILANNNCFQISVMGNISKEDCINFVNTIKEIVK